MNNPTLKPKKKGLGMEMRTFLGRDGQTYLVFRTGRGSYHAFVETEAKHAARQCGADEEAHTHSMWSRVWNQ